MKVFYSRNANEPFVDILYMTDAERDLVMSFNGRRSRLDLTVRATANARMEFYNDEDARFFIRWLGKNPPEHFPLLMPVLPVECV